MPIPEDLCKNYLEGHLEFLQMIVLDKEDLPILHQKKNS